MKKTTLGPDFLVGLFVLCGLAAIAVLIILLSGASTADISVTRITVKMESADGLIRGTKVMMSGVRIGRVMSHPELTPDGQRAIVRVAVQQPFRIRQGSNFVVKPEGILGDRFVEVIPPDDPDAPFLNDGDIAEGSRMTGLGDLADTAQDVVARLKPTLDNVQLASKRLDSILAKVDGEVLTDEATDSLRNTIKELGAGVDKLNELILGAGQVVNNTRDATGSLKSAMARVDEQLLDERTINQLKNAISDLQSTVANLQSFTEGLTKGEGVIGRLANDKKLADDLAAFVQNLRQRGILFYADVASRDQQQSEPARPTVRPTQSTRR